MPKSVNKNKLERTVPKYLGLTNKTEIYLALVGLCFLVYTNSLFGAFIYDDIPVILQNPLISQPHRYLFNPPDLLYSLNYLIAKDNPFIYHLTNLMLHALNTILVFIFLALFFKTEASLLGAALFAVHPIHAEAVDWITARGYLIITLFILITYFLYYRATYTVDKDGRPQQKINIPRYILSLVIFSYFLVCDLSFYSLVPFFLILSDIIFQRWRKNWKWWIPFLVILGIRIFLARNMISARVNAAAHDMGVAVSWHNPIPSFVYSILFHFGLIVWPARLSLYHQPIVFSPFVITLGLIVFGALICSAFFWFKKAKEIFFALAIFILFLAPTYSPVIITSLVAERYVYFPSVTLSIFMAFFYERYKIKPGWSRQNILILLLIIIAAYGVRTVIRNEDWRTQNRFWRATLTASPGSPWAHNNMGYAYQMEGNIERAIREYQKAIELRPNLLDPYNNLGTAYHHVGRLEDATAVYKKILEIDSNYIKAYNNLGVIYNEMGKNEDAIAAYKKAIEINPGYAYSYFNLGVIYDMLGNKEEAQGYYNKAILLDPNLNKMKDMPAPAKN